jgi:hypothetical protein
MCIRTTVPAGAIALVLAISPTASADTIAHQINMPMTFLVSNPCAVPPDDVLIDGTIDLIFLITVSASGASHVKIHAASKGTGTGFPSGDKYIYSVEDNEETTAAGAFTATQTLNHYVTSASATGNFFLKVTVHSTIKGLDVPTASVSHVDTGCRG